MNAPFTRRTFLKQCAIGLSGPLFPGLPDPGFSLLPRPTLDTPSFHLTAHPWQPLHTENAFLLELIEGLCRFSIQYQNESGAIIDPVIKREHQYATPYFAYAAGTLIHAGYKDPFLDHGVRAMEHATSALEGGNEVIPDRHGEFFIAPLASALSLYEGSVDSSLLTTWTQRLTTPVSHIIEGWDQKTNNWRTYAMKGEWLRAALGLVDREDAVAFIEDAWLFRTQRERIEQDRLHLYQDWNGHPQSHAVEAVGRGNLLALIHAGYDGPSAEKIKFLVEDGTAISLKLQDPTGQCPPNGRTDNHVFNDVLYQLIFDTMAERCIDRGDAYQAGQYRRSANLALQSITRWQRDDEPWKGSFYITKNFFDPEERIGYQPASQYSNYSGAMMYHLSEAYHTRTTRIEEQPAPTEIGGYAFATDERFGSMVANAGGMQMFANLRGDSVPKYETYWTPLGVVRFSRVNWDSRLGPSDGARDFLFEEGVTFGPTWNRGNEWIRIAMAGEHYHGTLRVDFVHPLLVKCSILYAPVTGVGGPNFFHDFVITPDGILTSLRSPHPFPFGLTIPLLEDDGRLLNIQVTDRIASTTYAQAPGTDDEQHIIAVNKEDVVLEQGESVLSTYGWIRPVRLTANANTIHAFVYPRAPRDPMATDVEATFRFTENGFASSLGRVEDTLYIGRHAAGGFGQALDLSGTGSPDISFDQPCQFIVQHDANRITAIESDTAVTAHVGSTSVDLLPFTKKEIT